MTERLGIGLIGAGIMGRNHARVIQETGARLVAVADPDKAAVAHIAERYGAKAFADPGALLKEPGVQAVVIATPTVLHFDVARAALEAGKDVLVEKPITATEKEARELIRLAEQHRRVLAVGQIERHNPVVRWVKDALGKRSFGEPISIQTRRLSPFPDRIRDVGVMLDIGIHDLDIIRYLAGAPPQTLYALAGSHRKLAVEDHATVLMGFANGLDGVVECSWLTPTKVRTLTITCDEGVIEADYMSQHVSVSRGKFGAIDPDNLYTTPVDYTVERMSLRKEEPLKNEHLDFQRAIRENGKPLADGRDGLEALLLAQAALQSAREKRALTIEAI